MIDRGSIVKLVNMSYEHETGFDKSWLEGTAGEVIRAEYVRPGYGLMIIRMLTPIYNTKSERIEWLGGVHVSNLQEITRVPLKREPVIQGG